MSKQITVEREGTSTRQLALPALPAPLNTANLFLGSWSANWHNRILDEGNTIYCKICEKVISNRVNAFNLVISHIKNHFGDSGEYEWNFRDVHEYLIIIRNAWSNKNAFAVERKLVASLKVKGQKLTCDICNKDISKTPDKARHVARHFADNSLPADYQKYLKVTA